MQKRNRRHAELYLREAIMIWNQFAVRCDPLPSAIGYAGLYLTRPDPTAESRRWLIGPYNELGKLAPALRANERLRDFLAEFHVRFGERSSDSPSTGTRRPRIGDKGAPILSNHLSERLKNIRAGAPACRETDKFPNAADFWRTQTLQAHHIVEKSILQTLGVNKGDLADKVAPCVLIVAEFHQRLFTAEMAGARGHLKPKMTGATAYHELKKIYDELYFRPVTAELRIIADQINQAVRARK